MSTAALRRRSDESLLQHWQYEARNCEISDKLLLADVSSSLQRVCILL